jgi:hypothetical protein
VQVTGPPTPLLDTINYPVHLKNLGLNDLKKLCKELRAGEQPPSLPPACSAACVLAARLHAARPAGQRSCAAAAAAVPAQQQQLC